MLIVFAGTPEIAATVLLTLLADSTHEVVAVYTQPDRPAGRGRQLHASPVKQLAEAHQIEVVQPHTLRDATTQKQLQQYEADLMVVVAYGLLLPDAVLSMPQHGCWNVHVSLLPRWRGAAPIQRAIEAGDSETGVTIMQMDAGLDTGDILLQQHLEITPTDTAASLHDRLADLGAQALQSTLQQLTAGDLVATQQDNTQVTYAHKLSKAEAALDWGQSAECLARKVRAFSPWPVCTAQLDAHLIRIHQVEMLARSSGGASPGAIVAVSKQGIDVATGRGVLRILRLQLPGAKVLPVADVVNAKADWFRGQCFQLQNADI